MYPAPPEEKRIIPTIKLRIPVQFLIFLKIFVTPGFFFSKHLIFYGYSVPGSVRISTGTVTYRTGTGKKISTPA
jgi:hypothetical protein